MPEVKLKHAVVLGAGIKAKTHEPDTTVDVSDALAKDLIAAGAAVPVEQRKAKRTAKSSGSGDDQSGGATGGGAGEGGGTEESDQPNGDASGDPQ